MVVKFNGKWEAERVARVVEMWNPVVEDLKSWRDDVVRRIRCQVDAARRRCEEMKQKPKMRMESADDSTSKGGKADR